MRFLIQTILDGERPFNLAEADTRMIADRIAKKVAPEMFKAFPGQRGVEDQKGRIVVLDGLTGREVVEFNEKGEEV